MAEDPAGNVKYADEAFYRDKIAEAFLQAARLDAFGAYIGDDGRWVSPCGSDIETHRKAFYDRAKYEAQCCLMEQARPKP